MKDGCVRVQRGGGRLSAKDRGLRRNQPCPHLDLGTASFQNCKKLITVVQATLSVVFRYGSPANKYSIVGVWGRGT